MKKETILIVNGFPRAGKTSFMNSCDVYLEDMDYSVKTHSTIDSVVEVAKQMGWDGEKTPDSRKMLSELKDIFTKYLDTPMNEIKEYIQEWYIDVLIVGMREPNEIQRTSDWCKEEGIRCITVLVTGPREEKCHESHSDSLVLLWNYDVVITNDGTLTELDSKAWDFCVEHFTRRTE